MKMLLNDLKILFYFSGLIWCIPLSWICAYNIIVINTYPEEHMKHHNTNKNEEEPDIYTLTHPIIKDWFISRECRLFWPFVAVNAALFLAYFMTYYFINMTWQSFTPHSSPFRDAEKYEL